MGMAAKDHHQFHVLAVDDSLLDRKLIERLLKTSSFHVTTVDSGSKALEFLGFEEEDEICLNQPSVSPNSQMEQEKLSLSPRKKDLEVNLVITDYCMPGMTGYDLLKKIKESSYLRNIPVVIMSSENVPSRISRCLEEGAEEFLLKPVRMSDVNKLRPHMLRAKYGDQKEEERQEQQQQEEHDDNKGELPKAEQFQQQHKQQKQTETQQELHPQNNNKRKPLDEGISPDRTRPRYSGLTVV